MRALSYGYCGMPCALCSRYHTNGESRCYGCSAGGYYTEACKAHHCCMGKQLLHCALCDEYPCVKLGKMKDFSDLNTNNAKKRISCEIGSVGFEAWYKDYLHRAALLDKALERYNNGRMKRYLCELFIQRDTCELEVIMKSAENLTGDVKEIGKKFQELVREISDKKFK